MATKQVPLPPALARQDRLPVGSGKPPRLTRPPQSTDHGADHDVTRRGSPTYKKPKVIPVQPGTDQTTY